MFLERFIIPCKQAAGSAERVLGSELAGTAHPMLIPNDSL
jgi:hypothetical protein